MNKTIEQTTTTDNATVSRLAYRLWEDAGRPAGRDLEFWLAAENKVRAGAQPLNTTVSSAKPAVKVSKVTRSSAPASKRTWPKPYPALPKF